MRRIMVTVAAISAISAAMPMVALAQTPDARTPEANADAGSAPPAAGSIEALENRIKLLEAALREVQAELSAVKAADRIVTIPPEATTPASAPPAPAAKVEDGFRIASQTVKYGGFIKLDTVFTNYGDGDPVNSDPIRDVLVPGNIPINGGGEKETRINARQTRFFLTTEGLVAGVKVGTRIEFDFQVLPGGADQRTTSPSTPGLRRAFFTIGDHWLFGQDWSTFMTPEALPESADYFGPSAGTIFVRQTQIRYSRGGFHIALESPETTIAPRGGGPRIVADDSAIPDFAIKYDYKTKLGDITFSGILRQLALTQGTINDRALGWGLTVTGRLKVGKQDDLRFSGTYGDGLGRYFGLNFGEDAAIDLSGNLDPIQSVGGFVAWRHFWTKTVRSSAIYSLISVDNPIDFTGTSANSFSQSAHVNLIWSPLPKFDLGLEGIYADRALESGTRGTLTRVQGFAKYSFQ